MYVSLSTVRLRSSDLPGHLLQVSRLAAEAAAEKARSELSDVRYFLASISETLSRRRVSLFFSILSLKERLKKNTHYLPYSYAAC